MPLLRIFLKRLYVRIWAAVVLAIVVLSLLSAWVMRVTREPPLREVVIRSQDGMILGQGRVRLSNGDSASSSSVGPNNAKAPAEQNTIALNIHEKGQVQDPQLYAQRREDNSSADDGMAVQRVEPPELHDSPSSSPLPVQGVYGPGPEFLVTLGDGQVLHVHLPHSPKRNRFFEPLGFIWLLTWVAIAVALATYPIVRRLTRRLEALQSGVEQWGEGNLSARVTQTGEDEIGFLAQRFNHAAAQIEALVLSHKTLLANASHELRTPLTRIRMGLELMPETQDPTRVAEIKQNIAELDQLIDEILLASRLDAKAVDLGAIEEIDLTGLASEECSRAGVELELGALPKPIEIMGVPRLIRRLLRNLIDNAVRHGGGLDGVEVSLAQLNASQVSITVADRGPGVPEAQRDRIFEPFFRLAGQHDNDKGAGLGLSLVQSIAKRHLGDVHHEPRVGGGSLFVVTLPNT
jgi:signal transduction histidine kinase